jgi:hypothetical protein
MEPNRRITPRVATQHTSRTRWILLDPHTGERRVVEADECFPIAGQLLGGVWQLDDGRVLLATTAEDDAHPEQRAVRIEYLDQDALAASQVA